MKTLAALLVLTAAGCGAPPPPAPPPAPRCEDHPHFERRPDESYVEDGKLKAHYVLLNTCTGDVLIPKDGRFQVYVSGPVK